MDNERITYKEIPETTQEKALVSSAILADIEKKLQTQSGSCSCSDYENCQYENRD